MSAAAMIWLPAPKATPWTAAITGTGSSRQPQAAYWALFAIPLVRSARPPPALLAPGSRSLLRLERSSPAQKARPSPDRTTTRRPAIAFNASTASAKASHIAGSSAFILSARIIRTSAIPPSSMLIEIRSFMDESLLSLQCGLDERELVVAEIHIIAIDENRRRAVAATRDHFIGIGAQPRLDRIAARHARQRGAVEPFGIGDRREHGRIVEIFLSIKIARKCRARKARQRRLIIF